MENIIEQPAFKKKSIDQKAFAQSEWKTKTARRQMTNNVTMLKRRIQLLMREEKNIEENLKLTELRIKNAIHEKRKKKDKIIYV